MKILKSYKNHKLLFDTDNCLKCDEYFGKTTFLTPFHHTHDDTDYNFLLQYFNRNAKIFENFEDSFFFSLDPIHKQKNNL